MFIKMNGHLMDIHVWRGMGEEIEDIVLWCHTCDPKGEKMVADIDAHVFDGTLDAAVQELKNRARTHAKYTFDMDQ